MIYSIPRIGGFQTLNSKLIPLLLIVQTGILLVLLVRLLGMEERLTGQVTAPAEVAQSEPNTTKAAGLPAAGTDSTLSETEVRSIIREELAPLMASLDGQAAAAIDNPVVIQYTPAHQDQRDLVSQRLDYYASIGRISGTEMQDLQAEIAKLHPSDRRSMLNRLIRTMNAGDMDGRL